LELVDKALAHLSEAPLGTVLETHILDSGIAKYFVMSQYAIQYLICCRTYLDECVTDLKEAHSTAQEEIATLRKSLSESNNEVIQLHKKITQIEAIREVVYPCHLCPKNFISNEALNVHIGRKHRVASPPSLASGTGKDKDRDKDTDVHLINTIKMELEIKQLKERLNAAEKNIKERSTGSKRVSPRQEQRTVGIQSNLAEPKDKDEDSGQARRSEDSDLIYIHYTISYSIKTALKHYCVYTSGFSLRLACFMIVLKKLKYHKVVRRKNDCSAM